MALQTQASPPLLGAPPSITRSLCPFHHGPRHAAFSSALLPQLPSSLLSGPPVSRLIFSNPLIALPQSDPHTSQSWSDGSSEAISLYFSLYLQESNFLAHEALLGPLQISAASLTALSLTLYTPATQAACGHPHRTHAHVHTHHPSHTCSRARVHTLRASFTLFSLPETSSQIPPPPSTRPSSPHPHLPTRCLASS